MKILLPIDGSDCSNKTLDWAITTFNRNDHEFYLLTVIAVSPDMMQVEYEVTDASKALRAARTKLECTGCKVGQTTYIFGNSVDRICEYADEIAADQIIIGSHGRTGLNKILMGSTSIAVMEHARQPVTIYRNVEPTSTRGKTESVEASLPAHS